MGSSAYLYDPVWIDCLESILLKHGVDYDGYEIVIKELRAYYVQSDSNVENIIRTYVSPLGCNFLHIACYKCNESLGRYCLEIGIGIEVCTYRNQNCLHYALVSTSVYSKNGISLVKYLLRNGADYNKRDYIDWSPLHVLYGCSNFSRDEKTEIQQYIDLLQLR